MKQFMYLFLMFQFFILSACQPNEIEPELLLESTDLALELSQKELPTRDEHTATKEPDQPVILELPTDNTPSHIDDKVSDENPEQEIESEEIDTQPDFSIENPDPEEEEEEAEAEAQIPIEPSKDTQSLFLENGPGRQYYETKPYFKASDPITVNDGEKDFAIVQFKSYKIIEDQGGSGRKGIALYFTETNISDEKIEVGAPGRVLNPVLNNSVFFNDLELKTMPHNEEWLKFADIGYIENQHVEFTSKDAKVESCAEPKILKPGKSRDCYEHYSYPGPGEYLINQALDPSYMTFKSYIIEVE